MALENKHICLRNNTTFFPKLTCMVLFLQLLLIPTANAVELLISRELTSHCGMINVNPEGSDEQYCVRYIQGFIDGAVTTDVRVMLNAKNAITNNETFTKRAIRTRVPGHVGRSREAKLADFCLGEPLPLRNVVDDIVIDLAAQRDNLTKNESAMEVVYKSLMTNYPCKQ